MGWEKRGAVRDPRHRGKRGGGRGSGSGRGRGRAKWSRDGTAKDIGCVPGNPANTILPWSEGESVPAVPRVVRTNLSLAPYLRTQPKQCAILVDRHVHKNGGSTVRDVLIENERMGHGLYQGYCQMYWRQDFGKLRKHVDRAIAKKETPQHLRLMIEAHFGWVEFSQVVMPDLQRISQYMVRNGVDCPVVTMTRVREPLEFYLSFYRWAVAFRQKTDPASFGKDFMSWARAVPDLQSTIMVQSMAAMAAEYHINQWRFYQMNKVVGRTPEEQWAKLTAFLDQVPPPPGHVTAMQRPCNGHVTAKLTAFLRPVLHRGHARPL